MSRPLPPLWARRLSFVAALALLVGLSVFQSEFRAALSGLFAPWLEAAGIGSVAGFRLDRPEVYTFAAHALAMLTANWLAVATYYWDRSKSRLALAFLLLAFVATMALNVLGKLAGWPKTEEFARYVLYQVLTLPLVGFFLIAAFRIQASQRGER